MSSTASLRRAKRSLMSGHSKPSGASLSDSPVPTPRMTRPGNSCPSVPKACATIAGWWRNVGVSTEVPMTMRSVFAPSAPSQAIAAGACPSVCFHGCRWSEMNTDSKPACSARTP